MCALTKKKICPRCPGKLWDTVSTRYSVFRDSERIVICLPNGLTVTMDTLDMEMDYLDFYVKVKNVWHGVKIVVKSILDEQLNT